MKLNLSANLKIGLVFIAVSGLLIFSGLWIFGKAGRVLPQIAKTPNGTIFGTRSELPSHWPEDIPIPQHCELTQVTEAQSRNQKRINLILESPKPVREILSFYQTELKNKKWEGVETFQPDGGEAWVYKKGERSLELIIVRDIKDNKTITFLKTTL